MKRIVREIGLLLVIAALVTSGVWIWSHRRSVFNEHRALLQALDEPSVQTDWAPPKFDGQPNRNIPAHPPIEERPALPQNPTDDQIAGCRVLPNRLWPVDGVNGRAGSANENAEVAALLSAIQESPSRDLYDAIEKWLPGHRDSRWFHALRAELMNFKWSLGYFDEARAGWKETWDALKSRQDINAYHLANDVLAPLLDANVGFARADILRELVDEASRRPLNGALDGKLFRAREAVWLLDHTAAQNVMCGPLALNAIKDFNRESYIAPRLSQVAPEFQATGLSLAEVQRFANNEYKLPMTAARRADATTSIPVPAVMHVKDNHFNALLATSPDGSQYFLEDRTLNFANWVDKAAVDRMSSGHFLLAMASLPPGWEGIAEAATHKIFGRDGAHGTVPTDEGTTDDDPKTGDEDKKCKGMPRYTFHPMPGAVRIGDIPLGYSPPVGPAVTFKINYNDLDSGAPTSPPTWSHVGLTWSTNWIAWIEHVSGTLTNGTNLRVRLPGGGTEVVKYSTAAAKFGPHDQSFAVVTKSGTYTYTRELPDGSKQVYNAPNNPTTPTRIFLSEVYDPQGNKLTLSYDANVRLVSVADAIGQVTTLEYTDAGNIYRITRVTDPFGRFAALGYNTGGRLTSVTDQLGLTTTFSYATSGFISTMVTPYGTTTFSNPINSVGSNRTVEVVDPLGGKEKVEFNDTGSTFVPSLRDPPATVMVGGQAVPFFAENTRLQFRNAYYWDKLANQVAPGDYKAAQNYRFFTNSGYQVVPVVEAIKRPHEDREWVNYPGGVGSPGSYPYYLGGSAAAEKRLRILADGTPRLVQTYSNALGKVTRIVDPLGRTTEYTYAGNNVDLLEVRQKTNGINERLSAYAYNAQHQPTAITDAAGGVVSFAYNGRGQVLSVTNAKSETTSFHYDSNGFLTEIDGPLAGPSDSTQFTYDAVGRTRTTTSAADGYTVTLSYDAFDRVTRIDYPDGSFAGSTFDKLDRTQVTDRLGRVTTYAFNANQQPVQMTDALNRITKLDWCRCGAINKVIDALGRVTQWKRDLQGRVVARENADGTKTTFEYDDAVGQVKRITDERGQSKELEYHLDGSLRRVSYTGASARTAPVTYSYDPNYARLLTMVDGIGTTRYSYNPITGAPSPGGGMLAAQDGPFPHDTITFGYDVLGRVISTAVDGVASGVTYDVLGRIAGTTDVSGSYAFTYDGPTQRVLQVSRPNGVASVLSYFGNHDDRRLQEVAHRRADNTLLSRFAYSYDALGRVREWTQEVGGAGAQTWTNSYDAVDQLTAVSRTGATPAEYAYQYDAAGNRLAQTIDGKTTTYVYDAVNQLIGSSDTSAPAATYTWDAENRMVEMLSGGSRTQFDYDGNDRARRIRQYSGATLTSEATYVWSGDQRLEERDGPGAVVEKRFLAAGLQLNKGAKAGSYYYTTDHLGSIREVVNSSGGLEQRASYGPWGETSFETGSFASEFGFTGHFRHGVTGLYLAPFRTYDPSLGRWTSRDPLGEAGGRNLYGYAGNNPIVAYDPDGRWIHIVAGGLIGGTIGGVISYANGGSFWEGAAKGAVAGAITAAVGPWAAAAMGGGIGGAILGGAATGALADVAAQSTAIGLGLQCEFSLGEVGVSAVGGGLLSGASSALLNGGGKTILYSGDGTFGPAQLAGGTTINQTPLGSLMTPQKWVPQGSWKWASGYFASNATGEVTAILNAPLRPGAVYTTVEKPIIDYIGKATIKVVAP